MSERLKISRPTESDVITSKSVDDVKTSTDHPSNLKQLVKVTFNDVTSKTRDDEAKISLEKLKVVQDTLEVEIGDLQVFCF